MHARDSQTAVVFFAFFLFTVQPKKLAFHLCDSSFRLICFRNMLESVWPCLIVLYWDHVRGVQAVVEFAAGFSCVPRLMEEALLLHEKQCAGVKNHRLCWRSVQKRGMGGWVE